jgi:adenosylmethionine-8-amino-7-oxononanoate aminotransferase
MYEKFAHVIPSQFCVEVPQTAQALVDFEKWLAQHANQIAGVIIEPLVQGAGGMHLHSPDVLQAIYRLSKRHDLLFIADEIFTGFGRTASLFAVQQAEIVPDIICLSKALTGGTLPLAVTVANNLVYEGFLSDDPEKAFLHSSTYMGNPLACAAANASLDIFDQNTWQEKVTNIEQILQSKLAPLRTNPGVKDVRILGAIGAIELNMPLGKDLNWFKARTIEEGIWLRPLPSSGVIYTTPAFTIEKDELLKITQVVSTLITEWSKQYFA